MTEDHHWKWSSHSLGFIFLQLGLNPGSQCSSDRFIWYHYHGNISLVHVCIHSRTSIIRLSNIQILKPANPLSQLILTFLLSSLFDTAPIGSDYRCSTFSKGNIPLNISSKSESCVLPGEKVLTFRLPMALHVPVEQCTTKTEKCFGPLA